MTSRRQAGSTIDVAALASRVAGPVTTPGDDSYDVDRAGFDLSIDQRPAVLVGATSSDDIVAAVGFAGEYALPVGVLATGHGVTAPADGGLLINTSRDNAVRVDAGSRTATISAGASWESVIEEAWLEGLAPLCGSAPAVGAVGYTLGGGLGPLGRLHGFSADRVRLIRVVTADGELRQASADEEPDLFWAMRGGGGNFGVVTELDVELFPVAELYGGNLYFHAAVAEDVLTAFAECAAQAPDELTLSLALINYPDLPDLPDPLRDRFCAQVRVACAGPGRAAEDVIHRLRTAADVVLDTVKVMPFADVGTIHNDPTAPQPENVRSLVLQRFDEDTIEVLVRYAEPTTPFMIELRHLGGALAEQPAVANPVGHRGGVMNLITSAYPGPGGFAKADAMQRQLLDDLGPSSDGGALFTFLGGEHVTAADVEGAFSRTDFNRLREVKSAWDPENMFRFNANVPPAAA